MTVKAVFLVKTLRPLLSISRQRLGFRSRFCSSTPTNCSTICANEKDRDSAEVVGRLCSTEDDAPNRGSEIGETETGEESVVLLRRWGCSDEDILKLLHRRPSLRHAYPDQLSSKLNILRSIGITGPDLVKVINCRPKFLGCRIDHHLNERLEYFVALFGTKEMLRKAIIRNPSFLIYDFHKKIKPAIQLYEKMGIKGEDLASMLLSRPTMIPRTSFQEEKLDYIRKIGLSPTSKMYKYVVTLVGISRLATIREKLANLEKFGFSEDEVLGLLGRSPLLLTLSVDKIQRNMTFVLGTMKLPAETVLQYPFLLYSNLEAVLKPRIMLGTKIQDMELQPQVKGSIIFRALRMTEKRFLNVFVRCHPQDVADELMAFYKSAKCVKRLAATSRRSSRPGFPF